MNKNTFGQPIGTAVEDWAARPLPKKTTMEGRYCDLEALDISAHADSLYEAFKHDDSNWTYLFVEPFHTLDDFIAWLESTCLGDDSLFYSIVDKSTKKAVGMASLMRIDPKMGVIEVGNIHFSPLIQKKPIATEAMFLMMNRVFDELGYRRYEWKCDSLNAPSRRAAERFGFSFEGVFRQAVVYKGRNRDTAWFSIIDTEWAGLKIMFEAWLSPQNFDESGQQIQRLNYFKDKNH